MMGGTRIDFRFLKKASMQHFKTKNHRKGFACGRGDEGRIMVGVDQFSFHLLFIVLNPPESGDNSFGV